MSIENGISILLHSSGVLCVLKGYAASLKQTLKIVQSLVQDRKLRLIEILSNKRSDTYEPNYFQSRPMRWTAPHPEACEFG